MRRAFLYAAIGFILTVSISVLLAPLVFPGAEMEKLGELIGFSIGLLGGVIGLLVGLRSSRRTQQRKMEANVTDRRDK